MSSIVQKNLTYIARLLIMLLYTFLRYQLTLDSILNLSAIMAINSELVGFPRSRLIV